MSSSSSDSSSEEHFQECLSLKPFDFDPEYSPDEEHEENEELTADENGQLRIGNTDLCLCGSSRAIETSSENLCCKDTNDIPDDHFEGIHPSFFKKAYKQHIARKKNYIFFL